MTPIIYYGNVISMFRHNFWRSKKYKNYIRGVQSHLKYSKVGGGSEEKKYNNNNAFRNKSELYGCTNSDICHFREYLKDYTGPHLFSLKKVVFSEDDSHWLTIEG